MAPKATPNAPKPKKITQAALGRHLEISERSVRELFGKGVFPATVNSKALTDADLDVCRVARALRRFNPKARFKMLSFADPLRFIRYYYHCHRDRGTNGGPRSIANYAGIDMHFSIAHGHTGHRRGKVHMAGYIGDPGQRCRPP